MEFNEKLQELRKNRGLTQEELAEALYVSRTAISKWESGRGYPSIDSLKELSRFFSVTIDELLSSEKAIYIAEKENRTNIQSICDFLSGIVDVMNILLIILPLYPDTINGYVYSVPLFMYTELSSVYTTIYWILFITLILTGVMKLVLNKAKNEKYQKLISCISIVINIAAVLLLAMTRQAYAITVSFILLLVKTALIIKNKSS